MNFEEWVLKACFTAPSSQAYDFAAETWKASQLETMMLIGGTSWQDSPFRHLHKHECLKVVDDINKRLKGISYYFMFCASGLVVMDRCNVEVLKSSLLGRSVFEAM